MWEKVPAEPTWEYHAKTGRCGKDCRYPNIDKSKLEVVNAVRKKLEDADMEQL